MALDFSRNSGSKLINNVVQTSNKIAADGKKHDIPTEDIVFNKKNEYLFGMKNIESFAEHIKEDGFHGAIEVFALPDGKYEIFSGHRRYLALKKLGHATIPCIVSQNVDDVKRLESLMGSNIHNRSLSPLNYARCIDVYKTEILAKKGFKGDKRKQCAKYFDISGAQVYRYECINKMIPELQQLCDDNSFPYSALTFAGNMTEELQRDLYELIMSYYEDAKKNANSEEDEAFIISKVRVEQMIKEIQTREERKSRASEKRNEKVEKVPVARKGEKAVEELLVKNDDELDQELNELNIKLTDDDIDHNEDNEIIEVEEVETKGNQNYVDNDVLVHLDSIKGIIMKDHKFRKKEKVISYLKKLLQDLEEN